MGFTDGVQRLRGLDHRIVVARAHELVHHVQQAVAQLDLLVLAAREATEHAADLPMHVSSEQNMRVGAVELFALDEGVVDLVEQALQSLGDEFFVEARYWLGRHGFPAACCDVVCSSARLARHAGSGKVHSAHG